jgi:molecular chaperone DnaK
MDELLIKYAVGNFQKETGIDLTADKMAMWRVREACEKAKIELSTTMSTEVNLPFIAAGADGPKHLAFNLTRAKLEELVEPVVNRCRGPVERAMKDSNLSADKINAVILVGGPTRMPVIQRFVETVVGKKIQRGVDPMECVAMGAAVQAAVLAGEVKDVLLLDVTPLSLGIETLGGIATKLIERNTTIPTRKSQIFSTAADGQTSVEIHVTQGERPMAKDNTSLGRFMLMGIPPAPRGVPQIEVAFDIDANGIVNVSAKDLGTGKEAKITITASTKLSTEDIDKMVKEAERFADEDLKNKEKVEIINQADQLTYATEKALSELGEQASNEERTKIEALINDVREEIKKGDAATIKTKMEALQKEFYAISTRIYQNMAQKQQADGQQQGPAPQDDNVVDADYKIVDDQ